MSWQLNDRRGRRIAAGSLEHMLTYLKGVVHDGEYQMVGPEGVSIPVRRHNGVVYPFDRWEGWQPGEALRERFWRP